MSARKIRTSDGTRKHEDAKRAIRAPISEQAAAQLADLRGFNQAVYDDPRKYFRSNKPKAESEPAWSKFPGKEVR